MTDRRATIVFDFDGTVALGDGPVRAYAREAAGLADAEVATAFLDALDAEWAAPRADALDHYDLVRLLATERGIAADALSHGYLASRQRLATEDAPVHAPEGLAGFLATAAERGARLVLATNAPGTRIPEALVALGLGDSFDEIHTGVGKPLGLDVLLDGWLVHGPVLGLGDVWSNDLAPIAARDGATILIAPDGAAPARGVPDHLVTRLEDAYPLVLEWLDRAAPHS